jgi:heme-degrading monooxygenase HmoA
VQSEQGWAPEFCSRVAVLRISSYAGAGDSDGVVEIQMQTINNEQVARSVRFDIAADKNEEFHTIFRNDVLPVLKNQDGFRNELLLVDNQHVLSISVWKNLDAARKYESGIFPQIDKALRPVMSGKPTVETYRYDSLSTSS